jgi:hypothetical protein
MTIQIESLVPQFGDAGNYNIGYIGFTYDEGNIISKGIAYFTNWHRMSDIKVSHALIVTGENKCVEADLKTGVDERNLTDYFNNEKCQVFFRKPKGLTANIAKNIAEKAISQKGCEYDIELILHMVEVHSHLGWIINRRTRGEFERLISIDHEGDEKWICSELAAYCLDEQPEYKNQGILGKPNATIDPQELFEDLTIFEPWKMKCDHTLPILKT